MTNHSALGLMVSVLTLTACASETPPQTDRHETLSSKQSELGWDDDADEDEDDGDSCSNSVWGCGPDAFPKRLLKERDWRHGLHDVLASGYNAGERKISVDTVGSLALKWTFSDRSADPEDVALGRVANLNQRVKVGPVHTTPVVEHHNAYFGDFHGYFYAVDRHGREKWHFGAIAPNPVLRSLFSRGRDDVPEEHRLAVTNHSPFYSSGVLLKHKPYVIFADADSNVYALDRESGEEIWTHPKLDPNLFGGVSGNAILLIDDEETVIVGLSSNEIFALFAQSAEFPYQCCNHRGGVVALDTATGAEKWRWNSTPEAGPLADAFRPFQQGPSGADVWGQPTYDADTNTLYVGTGQGFSPGPNGLPAANTDSIVALDASTGEEKWAHQFTPDDVWVIGVPNPSATGQYADKDFADSPHLYFLGDRKVVGAGQKDGRFHVVDAATGESIASTTVVRQFSSLGGLQIGGAVMPEGVIQHGMDRLSDEIIDPTVNPFAFNGVITARSHDGTQQLWRRELPSSPTVGPVAGANGLVFVQNPVAEDSATQPAAWSLLALDARSGATLKTLKFPGRAVAGPSISRGRVYVGFGNGALLELGRIQQGGVMSFALTKRH